MSKDRSWNSEFQKSLNPATFVQQSLSDFLLKSSEIVTMLFTAILCQVSDSQPTGLDSLEALLLYWWPDLDIQLLGEVESVVAGVRQHLD